MYVSVEEYRELCPDGEIPDEQLAAALESAQRDIDSLTYNRIVRRGFDTLTAFQQEQIKRAVCDQANFCFDNADILENTLSSYGINGVSMSFDKERIVQVGGVVTAPRIFTGLRQTGLTFRGVCG